MRQPINVWVLIRSDTLPDHYAEPKRLRQRLYDTAKDAVIKVIPRIADIEPLADKKVRLGHDACVAAIAAGINWSGKTETIKDILSDLRLTKALTSEADIETWLTSKDWIQQDLEIFNAIDALNRLRRLIKDINTHVFVDITNGRTTVYPGGTAPDSLIQNMRKHTAQFALLILTAKQNNIDEP